MVVLGIDEVGRGSWAGPLLVGAVALDVRIKGIKDSKLLTREQRTALDKVIREKAKFIGLGWVKSAEIDKLGLSAALKLGAARAIRELKCNVDEIIIDGNFNYLPQVLNAKAVIKADLLVQAVSAASIVAKVARDNFMIELHKTYPKYLFCNNVGYGTKKHRMLINEHGICPQHRLSYQPMKSLQSGPVL